MYTGKLVFSQVMEHLPLHVFHKCVDRYNGNYKVKEFSCLEQYLCMAFAQLTYRESLRDIEEQALSHGYPLVSFPQQSGQRQQGPRLARKLYMNNSFGLGLENTVYALDATTIDLCLSMFPWANRIEAVLAVHV